MWEDSEEGGRERVGKGARQSAREGVSEGCRRERFGGASERASKEGSEERVKEELGGEGGVCVGWNETAS